MRFMDFLKYFIIFTVIYSTYAVASKLNTTKMVNVIAFWGYLDDPKITSIIEKKCNVKLSHDTYYTNEEFLNIFNKRKSDYDVMIFSNLVYGLFLKFVILNKYPYTTNVGADCRSKPFPKQNEFLYYNCSAGMLSNNRSK